MAFTIIRPADRQGWLAQREKGIGSSEVGTILGVNPWETPYQLWRRKKGIDAPVEENEAMRAGRILETAVASFFEEESGRRIIKSSQGDWLAVDRERDFLRVSPDRTYWLEGKHSNDNKGIVECKTTQLDIDADSLPKHWFCQLQYQLGVMGYRQGSLAWLTRGRRFGYRDFDFDPDFYAAMVQYLERFWKDYIVGDLEPDYATIDDAALKFPRSVAGKTVEASDDLMGELTTLKCIKPQIDELTRQKKEIEDHIKLFMADAESLCMAGTRDNAPVVLATYKSAKDSTRFNEKAFAADHPELYKTYQFTQAGSRRFLLK